eukprot:TRINITY_DN7482_c0_g1_i1.p1 TRINITY_DN7482_c0_g1~~TRINITY_DN7482_c0_g1_i1.p1  ORF type:complete len:782 (+),score=141.07 TRINITY_DN7482_c0_g1_i1:297-2348(+)
MRSPEQTPPIPSRISTLVAPTPNPPPCQQAPRPKSSPLAESAAAWLGVEVVTEIPETMTSISHQALQNATHDVILGTPSKNAAARKHRSRARGVKVDISKLKADMSFLASILKSTPSGSQSAASQAPAGQSSGLGLCSDQAQPLLGGWHASSADDVQPSLAQEEESCIDAAQRELAVVEPTYETDSGIKAHRAGAGDTQPALDDKYLAACACDMPEPTSPNDVEDALPACADDAHSAQAVDTPKTCADEVHYDTHQDCAPDAPEAVSAHDAGRVLSHDAMPMLGKHVNPEPDGHTSVTSFARDAEQRCHGQSVLFADVLPMLAEHGDPKHDDETQTLAGTDDDVQVPQQDVSWEPPVAPNLRTQTQRRGKEATPKKHKFKASTGKPAKKIVDLEREKFLDDPRGSAWACLVDSFLQVASFGLWSEENLAVRLSEAPSFDKQLATKITGKGSWSAWTFKQWRLGLCHTMMLAIMFSSILFLRLTQPEAGVGRYASPGHLPATGCTAQPPPPFQQPSVVRPSTMSTGALIQPTTKSSISTGYNTQPPLFNNIVDKTSYEAELTESLRVKNKHAQGQWDKFLRESKATLKKLKNTVQLPRPACDAYKRLKDSRQKALQLRKRLRESSAELKSEGSPQPDIFLSARTIDNIAKWHRILSDAKKCELQDVGSSPSVKSRVMPVDPLWS